MDSIAAPLGQLFHSPRMSVCLWFLSKGHRNGQHWDRRAKTVFMNVRKLDHMMGRTHRDLSAKDITCVADTYHTWRDAEGAKDYADVLGFCKAEPLEKIHRRGHVLPSARYVGAEGSKDDGKPFQEKMARLSAQWREQQAGAARLDAAIAANLVRPGFGNHEPILEEISNNYQNHFTKV